MYKVLILSFVSFLLYPVLGLAQDPVELRMAADTGNTQAMIQLSEMYQFGMGVNQSDDSAAYWVQKSADLGDPDGLYLIGVKSCTQIFSVKSFAEGVKLLKKAAEMNHAPANLKLSEIYRKGREGTQTDKYYSLKSACKYAQKAADIGNEDACLYVAGCYASGKGATRNDSLANVYYRRAVEDYQHPLAQIRLGKRYLEGKVTGKTEIFEALNLYHFAYENPRSNIDRRTEADIHIHEADLMLKQIHNLMMQSSPFLPHQAFGYRLRKL